MALGYVTKPWIDYGLNHEESIDKYFHSNIQIYDFDTGGDETHDFLFEDGKAFRLEYTWWSEWQHDDDDYNGPRFYRYLDEISPDEADVPDKKQRDWI